MLAEQAYCAECCGYRTFHREIRTEYYPVKNESVAIEATIAICDLCKEEIIQPDIEQNNLALAYAAYRQKYGLLQPEEIRALREKYRMGQRKFARLLGWGDVTVHRYEAGAVQDVGHNQSFRLLQDPRTMYKLLLDRQAVLKPREFQQALETARREMQTVEAQQEWVDLQCAVDRATLSGGRKFELEVFGAMIGTILRKQPLMSIYHLSIFLWLADMLHHRQYGKSLSGAAYIKHNQIPVPQGYLYLLGVMENAKIITLTPGASGECTLSSSTMIDALDERTPEGEIIAKVLVWARPQTFEWLAAYCGKQKALQRTLEGEAIPYKFAKDITISG